MFGRYFALERDMLDVCSVVSQTQNLTSVWIELWLPNKVLNNWSIRKLVKSAENSFAIVELSGWNDKRLKMNFVHQMNYFVQ